MEADEMSKPLNTAVPWDTKSQNIRPCDITNSPLRKYGGKKYARTLLLSSYFSKIFQH